MLFCKVFLLFVEPVSGKKLLSYCEVRMSIRKFFHIKELTHAKT